MPVVTFSGLATGLDTGSMVTQLVNVEKARATALETKQGNLTSQKSVISSLSSALSSLTTAMKGLDLATEVKPNTAVVSDDHVGVTASANAAVGAHDIRVKALAAAQVTQSSVFTSSTAGAAGTGGLDITVGGTTKSISWSATDSLASVADKINAAGAGVQASVVKVDDASYRLVVTAKETGTSKAPTFVETGDSLGLNDAGNIKRVAADAELTVDGIDIKRSTNSITDALAGVTLSLKSAHATTDADTTTTVSQDTASVTKNLQTFVDAYNKVNSALHKQLDYTGTNKGEDTLFGDSTLRGLQGTLTTLMSNQYGGSTLSALGITRDKTGMMSLDSAKLTDALTKDADAVAKVFVTGSFAKSVSDRMDGYTQTGGILSAKTETLTARSKMYQDSIDRITKNADALRTRLESQFNAMEKAISEMKAQSNSLISLLSSSFST